MSREIELTKEEIENDPSSDIMFELNMLDLDEDEVVKLNMEVEDK